MHLSHADKKNDPIRLPRTMRREYSHGPPAACDQQNVDNMQRGLRLTELVCGNEVKGVWGV